MKILISKAEKKNSRSLKLHRCIPRGDVDELAGILNNIISISNNTNINIFSKHKETMSEAPSFIGTDTLKNFEGIGEHDNRSTSFMDQLTQENEFDASGLRDQYQAKRHAIKGIRKDKDYNLVHNTINKLKKTNLSKVHDASKYKQDFLDLIINGNYRVKYIPAAARRDTVREYCKNHLDADGIPLYRLLATNATDPLGNSITDLNGDRLMILSLLINVVIQP